MIERFLKEIFSALVRLTLIPALMREVICRRKATIIQYHKITLENFERHISYLEKNYNIISLDDLVSALGNRKAWAAFPSKPLAITMDDGFVENYSLIPVLDKHKIPITIFVRPDYISDSAGQHDSRRRYLNRIEITELIRHGVSIGSHTITHPHLADLDDDDARSELVDSKNLLEKEFAIPIRHFAYPYGIYSPRELAILDETDAYISARTVKPGWNNVDTPPFQLRCMGVGDSSGINKMVLDVTGIFPFLRIVRKVFTPKRFNEYKTILSYITGILGLRGPISQHTPEQAELIKRYAKGRKRLVEIGVSEGGSAIEALKVMDPAGTIWLIDPYRSLFYPFFSLSYHIAKKYLSRFKERKFVFIRDYSHNAAGTWRVGFDYLLMDALNSEEGFMRDWADWSPFLEEDGVVLVQSARGLDGGQTGTGRAIRRLFIKRSDPEWEIIDSASATVVIARKKKKG